MPNPNMIVVMLEGKLRDALQCWGCGENIRMKDFPKRRENPISLHNLESATMVEDMEK